MREYSLKVSPLASVPSRARRSLEQPARARQRRTTEELFVADVEDLVALHAAGGLHLDGLAGGFADQGAGDGRADEDAALLDVGLVLADDLPGEGLALVVLDVDGGAEDNAAIGLQAPRVDHLGVGELRFDA